jgi:hypothetical protein
MIKAIDSEDASVLKLSNLFSWLTDKFWQWLQPPLKPIGPEEIIEGDVSEVMIKLESALNFRDLGGGAWLPWKGSMPAGRKSGTISFKFRPKSLSGESVITDQLPISLHFVINESETDTKISWSYSLDDPSFQNKDAIIQITEQIIKSLLAGGAALGQEAD